MSVSGPALARRGLAKAVRAAAVQDGHAVAGEGAEMTNIKVIAQEESK